MWPPPPSASPGRPPVHFERGSLQPSPHGCVLCRACSDSRVPKFFLECHPRHALDAKEKHPLLHSELNQAALLSRKSRKGQQREHFPPRTRARPLSRTRVCRRPGCSPPQEPRGHSAFHGTGEVLPEDFWAITL